VTARETLDRRALAALRFRDALGAAVTGPVSIAAPGVGAFRKPSGEVVVTRAPGLDAYAAAFPDPPAAPAPGAVTVTLDLRPADPGLAPRRVRIRLPRDPDPASATSIRRPVEIVLPPSVAARTTGLSAGLLVAVRHADGRRVEGALVRLTPAGGAPTTALTNAAGEALLLAAGLPLAAPGPGATVVAVTAATLDAVIDPAAVRLHADADLPAARAAEAVRTRDFPDPDALAEALGQPASGVVAIPAAQVDLRPGETRAAVLHWTPA
jgi:hypothetical protein